MELSLTAVFASSLAGLWLLSYLVAAFRRTGKKAPCIGSYPLVGSYFHIKEPLTRSIIEDFPGVPVVQVDIGIKTCYYLNTSAAIREAYVEKGDLFAGRHDTPVRKHLFGDAEGIVLAEGEVWKEYRRFTLKTLRDFGLGRQGAQEIIQEEADCLVKVIEGQLGEPMEMTFLLSVTTSNVICQLVFGSRLASEDADFKKVADIFNSITRREDKRKAQFILTSTGVLLKRFPFLCSLLVKSGPTKKLFDNIKVLFDYCAKQIEEHKAQMDPNAEARDYIEAHLKIPQDKKGLFTEARLTTAIQDLFLAGTDTTSHTIRWGLLHMIACPDVADKVFQEIQTHIGTERPPQMSDRPKMNYVNATIEEIHRLASVALEGVPRRVTEDTTVAGYFIEKDAVVKTNVFGIHYNPLIFPEPEKLRPERHLTSEGSFVSHEDVMPFGAGRRACLGESLARMELFIFFTTLMQRFSVKLAPGEKDVQELIGRSKIYSGGLRAAESHRVIFSPRS